MEGKRVEKLIGPEEFFKNKVRTIPVSREEFLELVRLKYPEKTDAEILQTKGINFDQDGVVIVLMRTDVFPEEYMPYLETHEKWEAYIARKDGYNLFKKSVRSYKEDKGINGFDEKSKKEFLDDIGVFNYDFRHEYAVYMEYKEAATDGKLDQYHKWIMDLREKEKQTAERKTLNLIENDTKIRQSIYEKLTKGTKHSFLRNH